MSREGSLYPAMKLGPHSGLAVMFGNGGANTFAMAALNQGWCARWQATDTRDVLSMYFNFSSVSAAGSVELRIETIDTTTLKPTGTLYDANATKTFTPVAGWQIVTFTTPPTTGLTVGNLYGAMLLTTTGGTTMTLRSHVPNTLGGGGAAQPSLPTGLLSAASANTRSNLAETLGWPICTWVMEDSVEETFGGLAFATYTTFGVYGTRAVAAKIVLAAPAKASGIALTAASIATASAVTGDLRLQILTSAGAVVSGADVTLTRKIWPTDFAQRGAYAPFAADVTLAAGTYYVVCRNADTSTTSGAGFSVPQAQCRAAGVNSSGFTISTTTDITAGTISWTDTTTDFPALGLMIGDLAATARGPVARNLFLGSGVSF